MKFLQEIMAILSNDLDFSATSPLTYTNPFLSLQKKFIPQLNERKTKRIFLRFCKRKDTWDRSDKCPKEQRHSATGPTARLTSGMTRSTRNEGRCRRAYIPSVPVTWRKRVGGDSISLWLCRLQRRRKRKQMLRNAKKILSCIIFCFFFLITSDWQCKTGVIIRILLSANILIKP